MDSVHSIYKDPQKYILHMDPSYSLRRGLGLMNMIFFVRRKQLQNGYHKK